MKAEGGGYLATMMQVILHHVADDPAPSYRVDLAFPLILNCRFEIRVRVASQNVLDDLPCFL